LITYYKPFNNELYFTEKNVMAGLAIGVASMKSGERALLHVEWELGYGKEGSFSFPNVPPMADLLYEVELIGFDEAKEVVALSFSLSALAHGAAVCL
jgi:FKBP-type peptidyl-prolyl cis-trans isomerase